MWFFNRRGSALKLIVAGPLTATPAQISILDILQLGTPFDDAAITPSEVNTMNPWPLEIQAAGGPDGQPLTAPGTHAAAISKSDTVNFDTVARMIWCGGAGNVVLVTANDEVVTILSVAAGSLIPIMTKRVNSTNTTATSMVAIW